jgi:DsbC/DsbD-like thiol-disulfide interchange protein
VAARSAAAALALVAAPAFAAADPARYMPGDLVAESLSPAPGSTIIVGFRFTPKPGWHGYWSNPGDSGIAPSVRWSAPSGISFGPLLHPAPTLISAGGTASFVHDGPHILLTRMSVARSIPAGTAIPVEARLSWAACTATQCVPLHATLTLKLVAGDGTKSAEAAQLAAAAAKVPRAAPAGSFSAQGNRRTLVLPASIYLNPARTRFFPEDNDAFVAASGTAKDEAGRLVVTGEARSETEAIAGVVTDGRAAYRITFNRAAAPAVPDSATPPAAVQPDIVPRATNEAKAMDPGEGETRHERAPWLPIAALALASLGVAFWLRRRRTHDQRPKS